MENYYNLTVEQVKAEVKLLEVRTIKKFPMTASCRDAFYEMWNRFGPEAARTAMIPYVWQGKFPLPSKFYARTI